MCGRAGCRPATSRPDYLHPVLPERAAQAHRRHLHRGARDRGARRGVVVLRGPPLLGETAHRRRRVPRRRHHHAGDHVRPDAARMLATGGPPGRHGPQRRAGSAVLPQLPEVLRAAVPQRQGPRPGAVVRAGLQRLDGRGVVRSERRAPDPTVPGPAVGRRPGGGRDPAQRGPRCSGGRLQRVADLPRPAEPPLRLLGPVLRRVRGDVDRALHAHRVGHQDAPGVARCPGRGAGHHLVRQHRRQHDRLHLLRDPRPLPEPAAAVRRVPDRMDPLSARASRRRLGDAPRVERLASGLRRTAVDLLLPPHLQLLLQGPRRHRDARPGGARQHHLRDRLSPPGRHVAPFGPSGGRPVRRARRHVHRQDHQRQRHQIVRTRSSTPAPGRAPGLRAQG